MIGVEAILASGTLVVNAKETILCAGAIHSPAMLLRAGIGPEQELKELGINVIQDRKAVGKNLQEHPTISVSAHIEKHARF